MVERLKPKRKLQQSADQKWLIFVNHYLKTSNGTASAIAAGYSPMSAHVHANRLLNDVKVQARLQAARHRLSELAEWDVARVIRELGKIAGASLKAYCIPLGKGWFEVDLSDLSDDDWAAIAEVQTETYHESIGNGKTRKVVRTKIKLHDKIAALEKIGKHLGAFDRRRGGGADDPGEAPPEVSYTLNIGNAQFNITKAEGQEDRLYPAIDVPKAIGSHIRTD